MTSRTWCHRPGRPVTLIPSLSHQPSKIHQRNQHSQHYRFQWPLLVPHSARDPGNSSSSTPPQQQSQDPQALIGPAAQSEPGVPYSTAAPEAAPVLPTTPQAAAAAVQLPAFMDGINWWVLSCCIPAGSGVQLQALCAVPGMSIEGLCCQPAHHDRRPSSLVQQKTWTPDVCCVVHRPACAGTATAAWACCSSQT